MYTPHTVTLYNVTTVTDQNTLEDVVTTNITILEGVFLDAVKASNVNKSGMAGADSASLHIPLNIRAVDAVSGLEREFASPKKYDKAEDKSALWTLETGNKCFFVKGVVIEPDKDFEYINKNHSDVHVVTKVDLKDFGSAYLQHWEVGGA